MSKSYHSYSSLSLYDHCPFDYYLRYILNVKQPRISHNLVVGKIVHIFLEDETQDINKIIDNELSQHKEIAGKTPEQVRKQVLSMHQAIKKYPLLYSDGFPVEIKVAEKEFYMPIEDYLIRGFIDAITKQGEILEHKTSSRKYTESFIRESSQHTLYELGFRFLYNKPSKGILYDVIYKTAKPVRELLPLEVQDYEIANTKKWIIDLASRINREEWKPYKQTKNPYFCDFKNICQWCNRN